MHELMAGAMDAAAEEIRAIQKEARESGFRDRPTWPMIVLRTPKGWTGPKEVDHKKAEGTFRSHQVPIADFDSKPDHVQQLETWMRSYRPEELFDSSGRLQLALSELAPKGELRMGANPHSNEPVQKMGSITGFRKIASEVVWISRSDTSSDAVV